MEKRFIFTKKKLRECPVPTSGSRDYYYDKKTNGLGFSVTLKGVRSFFVYRKLNRKPIRVTLGRFPDMTIEQARRQAAIELAKMAEGINPIIEKRANRASGVTLNQVFNDYLQARKSLKESTIKDYRRVLDEGFDAWKKRPLATITRDMVSNQHRKLGETSPARANNAMRVLRAMFNFAAAEYQDSNGNPLVTDNPVNRISHTEAWYRVDRRRTLIKVHELKSWFDGVNALSSRYGGEQAETVRDYLLLLLLTGLRREEAARLRWADVDLVGKTLTVPDTKNREPHTLPLSDYLLEMLKARSQYASNQYVFASNTSKSGHLINAHKQIQKVKTLSGIDFTAHDLRRTFITIAESLDVSGYTLKRLLNHKMNDDVTAGYIVLDIERLRAPMQRISDFITGAGGLRKPALVVPLNDAQPKEAEVSEKFKKFPSKVV